MRKIETVTYEYTEEDVKLLNTPLPKYPCDTCSCPIAHTGECLGCYDMDQYLAKVKSYQDAGVYEIALTLKKMREYESEMRGLLGEYTEMRESLPVIDGFRLPPDLSINMEF